MTPEAQRIAIAEACGWEIPTPEEWRYQDSQPRGWIKNGSNNFGEWRAASAKGTLYDLPDYVYDLNAMHEACCLTFNNATEWAGFACQLCQVVLGQGKGYSIGEQMVALCKATAAQRAEAFLRTIGKWEGGEV